MATEILPVKSRRDFQTFVDFPVRIYQGDPNWVQPLRGEEEKKFRPKGNPMLRHCDYALFLAFRNDKPVGRIAAFVDHVAVAHWCAPVGLFGSYECVDDPEVSSLLLDTASAWLRERDMKRMRGPWSFNAEEWGLVVKGGDRPPMVLAPYNPDYYPQHLEAFGLRKAKDLFVYGLTLDAKYQLPERFVTLTDEIAKRTGVRIRPVNMKRIDEDIRSLVRVSNESTQANWGHIPVTDAEAADLAKSLKPIIDPDLIMLAEVDGRAIGYQITLPDLNVILKKLNGRLLPFGIFQLLFGLKRIRQYRIWAMGVIPGFQRKAIDTLFYREMHRALRGRMPVKLEANWVLEDNMAMNNPILKLGFEHVKTYRVYEAKI